jgi:tripartite-type tricarboxylate transporter receptor subunit TctC
MKVPRRRFLHLAAGAAAISVISASMNLLSGQGAWSETPRTIKIVVPVPPGGGMDFLVRLLADQVAEELDLHLQAVLQKAAE